MIDEPRTEKEMQARWDAETLIRAKEIESDTSRLEEAQKAAVKLVEEKKEALKAVQKVATSVRSRTQSSRKINQNAGKTIPTSINLFKIGK